LSGFLDKSPPSSAPKHSLYVFPSQSPQEISITNGSSINSTFVECFSATASAVCFALGILE
jgi:hypothetical protein